jgi:hypothetical protein
MVISIFWLIMLFLGQVMSFIDYDFTVSLGLQEARDVVTDIGVALNKGFGVGDAVVYIPLLMIGLVGLWLRRTWGLIAMAGAFAITAYFPVVCMFMLFFARGAPGFYFTRFFSYTIFLSLIVLYGFWGLWYINSRRDILTRKE